MDRGERQIATDLAGIRKDHKARYEWAASLLAGKKVVDAACGVGYGSHILAEAGCTVRAFDRDPEAVAYANEHWAHGNISGGFYVGNAEEVAFPDERSGYDAVTAFEIIEHLDNPEAALKGFRRMAPTLLCSVPNELVWPYKPEYTFHRQHFTPEQFEDLLNRTGWTVTGWWGQAGPYSELTPNLSGRTLIVTAEASENPVGGTHRQLVRAAPRSVAILAMGASKDTWFTLCCNKGGRHKVVDEVWAINAIGGCADYDVLFHMDDLEIQKVRAAAQPDSWIGAMLEWMRKSDKPIITCKAYPEEFPATVEYPLEEVLNAIGFPYLNTTVAHAVAYAIAIGVKELHLYGADFTYPNLHKREKGRANVEFLLGMAVARGIHVEVANNSTLLDACEPDDERVYGYDSEQLTITFDPGTGYKVERRPRDKLPTAAEMEAKYCHVPPTREAA